MKLYAICAIAIALCVPAVCIAEYSGWWYDLPAGSGEVLYLFDDNFGGDTVIDSSVNSNYGTLGNSVIWGLGRYETAVYFEGSDTGIEISSGLGANPEELTFEAWIKVDDGSSRMDIVNSGSNIYFSRLATGNLQAEIYDASARTATGNRLVLPEHSWVHVAMVYEVVADGSDTGGSVTIYVNGKYDASTAWSTGGNGYCSYNSETIVIGSNTLGEDNREFMGKMDEIRISYQAYDFQPMDRLLPDGSGEALYRFDNDWIDTVIDASGTGNDGSVNNSDTDNIYASDGRYGYGVYFDESQTDGIQLSSALSTNPQKLTLEAWINVESSSRWSDIISGGGYIYFTRNSSNQLQGLIFDGANRWVYGNTTINSSTGWTHVALTYDGSAATRELKLYVNGVEDGCGTYTGSNGYCGYSGGGVEVGQNTSLSGREFKGWMDEVRICEYVVEFDTNNYAASTSGTNDTETCQIEYHLDEDDGDTIVADTSGNGNDGAITDSGATQFDAGNSGNALYFDGSTTYILPSDTLGAGPTQLTLETWIKLDDDTTNLDLFWQGGYIYFRIDSSGQLEGLIFDGANRYVYGDTTLTTDTWTHVKMTYDGTGTTRELELFVNGDSDGTATYTGSSGYIGGGPYTMYIGQNMWAYVWALDREFKGWMDDVRIAYGPGEGAGGGGDAAGLPDNTGEILYHFDELSGDTATDSSGNGIDGKVEDTGDAQWQTGRANYALYFDANGESGTIVEPNSTLAASPTELTMEAWIKLDGDYTGQDLFWQGPYIYLWINNSGYLEGLIHDGGNRYVYGNTDFNTTVGAEWVHVAMVYDGTETTRELKLYVNGRLDGRTTYTGSSGYPGGGPYTIYVGGNKWGYLWSEGRRFKGWMDEARITYGIVDFDLVQLDAIDDTVTLASYATSLGDWNVVFGNAGYDLMDTFWGTEGIECILDKTQSLGKAHRTYWRINSGGGIYHKTTVDEDSDGAYDFIVEGANFTANIPLSSTAVPGHILLDDQSTLSKKYFRLLDADCNTAMPVTYQLRIKLEELDGNADDVNFTLRYGNGNKYYDLFIEQDGTIRNYGDSSSAKLKSSTDYYHWYTFVCEDEDTVKVYIDFDDGNSDPIEAGGDNPITLVARNGNYNYFEISTRAANARTPSLSLDSCRVDTGAKTDPVQYPYESWGRLNSDYGSDTDWYQVDWSDDWNYSTFDAVTAYAGDVGRRYDYQACYDQEPGTFGSGQDALSNAADYADSIGHELYAWITLGEENHYGNDNLSRFASIHPEYCEVNENGDTWFGRLSYSHPEVRAHKLSLIKELVENYGVEGIMLDFARRGLKDPITAPAGDAIRDGDGVNILGYDAVARAAYETAYGSDPFDIANNTATWIQWRCDYFTQFLQDINDSFPDLPIIPMVFETSASVTKDGDLLDWDAWLDDGLISGICFLMNNTDDGIMYGGDWNELPDPLSNAYNVTVARVAEVDGRADVIIGIYLYNIDEDEIGTISENAHQAGADEIMWWESSPAETRDTSNSERIWQKLGESAIIYSKKN
jgi:Concanavalin A-like lectin/glucanases superfamily/Glycosyl hydrolase-like 10